MADYIEREEVLKCLKIARGYCPCAYDEIIKLPAADVGALKRGMWIYDGPNFHGGTDWCHCSECQSLEVWAAKTPFCSHCGAEMQNWKR